MTTLRSRTSLPALALTVAWLGAPVLGQEPPAREGRLSYGVGLDYDFDTGVEAISDIALTLITRTRSDRLEFAIGTELFGDFTDGGTDDFDFRDSSASVLYERTGANSTLRFFAGYTESNLEDEVIDSVIFNGGQLARLEFSGRFETGTEGPFGLTLDARYLDRDFTDAGADQSDNTEYSLDALARFSTSPSTSVRARAGITRTEQDDAAGTDTEVTYFGLGVATETAGGLSVTGDLLFDQSEVTTSAPPSSVTREGIGFDIAVLQDRPNGTVGANLSSRIDEAGRRTSAIVSREFDTKTGNITFSLGVLDQEGVDDTQIVGGIDYTIEMPRSVFTASLSRDARTDVDEAVIDTALELAYRQEIDAVSAWEASVGYFETDVLNGMEDNRTNFDLTYTRDLTDEWSMRAGYAYSKDEGEDASNSVFINIQRDITFGF